jgi:hypothetical protein
MQVSDRGSMGVRGAFRVCTMIRPCEAAAVWSGLPWWVVRMDGGPRVLPVLSKVLAEEAH